MAIFGSGAETRPSWTRMVAVVYASEEGELDFPSVAQWKSIATIEAAFQLGSTNAASFSSSATCWLWCSSKKFLNDDATMAIWRSRSLPTSSSKPGQYPGRDVEAPSQKKTSVVHLDLSFFWKNCHIVSAKFLDCPNLFRGVFPLKYENSRLWKFCSLGFIL